MFFLSFVLSQRRQRLQASQLLRFGARSVHASSSHGGREEDQEDAGEYQQPAGAGDEVRQVHAGLWDHAQVAARRQGQAHHHRQQLSPASQVRNRVLCHAFQDRRAPLQRQQRWPGHRLRQVLPSLLSEHYWPRRLRHHPLHALWIGLGFLLFWKPDPCFLDLGFWCCRRRVVQSRRCFAHTLGREEVIRFSQKCVRVTVLTFSCMRCWPHATPRQNESPSAQTKISFWIFFVLAKLGMWVWGLLECCCAEFLWLELSYVSCQAHVWYLVETYDYNSHRGFPLSYQWPCLTSFLIQLMMHWQNGAQWLVCVSISFHRQVPSCYGRSEQVLLSLICQKILFTVTNLFTEYLHCLQKFIHLEIFPIVQSEPVYLGFCSRFLFPSFLLVWDPYGLGSCTSTATVSHQPLWPLFASFSLFMHIIACTPCQESMD